MSTEKHGMPHGTVGLHEFVVLGNDEVARDTYRLEISSHVSWGLQPGQFMNFEVPGDKTHILRIPLSFAESDLRNSHVVIYYAVVGEGTGRLSQMQPGDTSTVVGPCGKGWRLPLDRNGRCLLISGGIGLPPVYVAASMLAEAGIGFDVIVGAQTEARLVRPLIDGLRALAPSEACDCMRRVIVTTDDGTAGIKGFTTDAMRSLLDERGYSCIYTCGPQVMMAGVAKIAAEHGIACQASMERMMGCGFGACGACNVPLKAGGYASCCMDGPVFDAEEVLW